MNLFQLGLTLVLIAAVPLQATAAGTNTAPLSLAQLYRAIDRFLKGEGQPSDLPFDIAGYSHHWRIDPGGGRPVVVISCNLNGYLLLFSRQGNLVTTTKTGEAVSIQLADLDDDGTSEIVLDEVKERGTGLLTREFHVYQVSETSVKDLWHGTSFSRIYHDEGNGKPFSSFARGSLWYSPSGGDSPKAHLVYGSTIDNGKGRKERREVILELSGDRLTERKMGSGGTEP